MKVWYTSDLHFLHENIIKYCGRPFLSAEEMNEGLVREWNRVVHPDDTVYCLGDFSLSAKGVEIFTPKLNGKKILILGNHDFPHPAHKKGRKPAERDVWGKKYLEWGWSDISMEICKSIGGIDARLCHLPYKDSFPEHAAGHSAPRYQELRPIDDGKVLICGHVHEKWKHKFSPNGSLMVNVGVDVWGMAPVSEEVLCQYIKSLLQS